MKIPSRRDFRTKKKATSRNFNWWRGFASVMDGGCRYESQNAVDTCGHVGRSTVGVWMRWSRRGHNAPAGHQRNGGADVGERSRW
jgi:hypothetical protein